MRLVAVLAVVLLVLGAACGNGRRGASQKFVFTPVPYTMVDGPEGSPVPVSLPPTVTAAHCFPYIADEVGVFVDPDHVVAFKSWMSTIGFSVRDEQQAAPPPSPTYIAVRVPLGSVLDAVALIRRQPGVIAADPNSLGHAPESPNLSVCPPAPVATNHAE
jgi:hypothetical protein